MLLSSPEKLSNYTGLLLTGSDGLSNRRKLVGWQAAISEAIENMCGRWFELKEYTEDFEIQQGGGPNSPSAFYPIGSPGYLSGRKYYPTAIPLADKPVVKMDPFGLFDGSETAIDPSMIYLSADRCSFGFLAPVFPGATMRATYTGGIGTKAVRSTFVYSEGDDDLEADSYVRNDTGTAVGIVRVVETVGDDLTVQIDNLYGTFGAGDDLFQADTEADLFGDSPDGVGTITSISNQSIAEAYPALEAAVEIEIRYCAKHQLDFENISSMNDQTQRRSPGQMTDAYNLQPEARGKLAKFIRYGGLF